MRHALCLSFPHFHFPPGRRPLWPLRLPARRACSLESLQLGEAGGRIQFPIFILFQCEIITEKNHYNLLNLLVKKY
jgi:hypothetical protein